MHDNATRHGVVALPVYGLLVFLSTLTHQPDYRTDFHAYAEYVTTTSFLVSHLVGSILGTTIGIFGVLALGAVAGCCLNLLAHVPHLPSCRG